MRPGVIGIGAQKCASSWLHAVAGSHPQIGVADLKEIDFFSYYFDHGYSWYEGQFLSKDGVKVYFENSPSYFHDPRAPERASGYSPDLKVIALLRDPIKRAFSNHLHEIIKGHIAPCTFEEGLENNPAYVEQGFYATHLKRWFDCFPETQILVKFAEEISAGPSTAARQVFTFLAVDPDFDSPILHERRNESDLPRLKALRTGLRSGGDWMRRRGLEPTLARIKSTGVISSMLKANSIDLQNEIPPMTQDTRSKLEEIFEPDLVQLRQMLGRNQLPWETVATDTGQ